MSGEGETVTTRRESDGVNPTSRVVQELSTDSVERDPLTPSGRLGAGIDALDEAGENTSVGIGRAGSKKDRIRMPGNTGDSAANWLLQVLGNPPVILLLEIADGNDAVAGTDGELVLVGRPADEGSSTADTEEDEGRLVSSRRRLPDESIPVYSEELVLLDTVTGEREACLVSRKRCDRCWERCRHWLQSCHGP